MQKGWRRGFVRNARFLGSLALAALVLFGFFAVVFVISSRIQGFVGVAVGIFAGACLALGVLLAYWTFADWLNLGIIRKKLRAGNSTLRDGEVVAFDGVVRIDVEPMIAPFSGTPCAAYTYVVAGSRQSISRGGGVRAEIAQGFHLVKTRIEGATQNLRLCSFPSFEDDLRENMHGRQWATEARVLIGRISGKAPSSGERERQSRLLEVRHTVLEEVHQDYCMGAVTGSGDGLVIDEEVLPVGQEVCVIGAYEKELNGLTARRSRLGANLIVYRGNAEEVLSRVGKETAGFAKTATFLVGAGVLLLGTSFLPPAWTSHLPILGLFIVNPSPLAQKAAVVETDPDIEPQDQIDDWVREEYLEGNRRRALELAIDENAYESLQWLIDRGVSPGTRIRVRGDWYQLPLVEAARLGYLETVQTLLEAGADPNKAQRTESHPTRGQTALGESLKLGHCKIAALLVKFGATPPKGLETNRCL